jgi:hypothetical protein
MFLGRDGNSKWGVVAERFPVARGEANVLVTENHRNFPALEDGFQNAFRLAFLAEGVIGRKWMVFHVWWWGSL